MHKENSFFSEITNRFVIGDAGLMITLGIVALLAYFFIPGFLFTVVGFVLLLVFTKRIDIALGVLAFVGFFTNWQIVMVTERWRELVNFPLPNVVSAPVSDLVALGVFGMLVVSYFLGWITVRSERIRELLKSSFLYLFFLLWAFVCAFNAYDHSILSSIKYVVRPMAFAFGMFVVMPYFIIQAKKTLYIIFGVWVLLGACIMLYGLSSLVVAPVSGFPRVTPYALFGVTPLGSNHNLVAEPLVALIPIVIFVTVLAFKKRSAWFPWLRLVCVGMVFVAMLTLSRAAWIALLLEAVVFANFNREIVRTWFSRYVQWKWIVGLLLIPVVVYMSIFLNSSIVSSSNESRSTMLDIVRFYAVRSPWMGYGPGSFITMINDTAVFIIEYGRPLDSHGFLQKVLLETGLIGLTLFVAFLFFLFRYLFRNQNAANETARYLQQFVLMSAVGAVVFQLFNTSYFLSTMWLPIGLALVSIRLIKENAIE